MSWTLWAQIMGLILAAGGMGRHVLEAPKRVITLTGELPVNESKTLIDRR